MVRINGEVVIHRPVNVVFDFVADERNEPLYNPRMLSAQKVSTGPIGPGTQWSAVVDSGGRRADLLIEVTDYDRPHRIGSTSTMVSMLIAGAVRFEPAETGTRLLWTWDLHPQGPLRVLGPLVGVMGRRQERETWARLKQHLEEGPSPR